MTAPSLAGWYGQDVPRPAAPQLPPIGAERLVAAWLESLSADTIKSYRFDMLAFARFVGAVDAEAAAKLLLSRSNGEANLLALEFRNDMMKRGLASASVNRRLAALRSFTKAARRIGLIAWHLEYDPLPAQPYRDTRGPGVEGFRKLMSELRTRTDAKGARDRAMVRLMFERGLRSNEVRTLDLGDVDLDAGTVAVLGKMRRAKERLSLAPTTVAALREWIQARGDAPGPLFVRLQFSHGKGRISRQGVYRMVRKLGDAAGLRARPHGLRHAAITEALDRGVDVRAVQRFSRHKSLATLLVYDDNRTDLARAVACTIAEAEPSGRRPAASATAAAAPRGLVPIEVPAPTPHELALKRGEASSKAKLSEADVLEIRRRHAAGEGPVALAAAFGIGRSHVGYVVARKSWKHVGGPPPRRQRRRAAPLTEADVVEIRRRHAAGEARAALAELFRTSEPNIDSIVTGKTWRHLPLAAPCAPTAREAPAPTPSEQPIPKTAAEAKAMGLTLSQWLQVAPRGRARAGAR